MVRIRYKGRHDLRELSAADAKRAEPPVTDFTKTTWTSGETHEVSDAAGEWLLRDLGDEFEKDSSPASAAASAPKAAPAKGSSAS